MSLLPSFCFKPPSVLFRKPTLEQTRLLSREGGLGCTGVSKFWDTDPDYSEQMRRSYLVLLLYYKCIDINWINML